MRYLFLCLFLVGCSTWQYPWNVIEEPKMGVYEMHVDMHFIESEALCRQCGNEVACFIRDVRGYETVYLKSRKGWSGNYKFTLRVQYVSWESILDLCHGYACIKDNIMYVHDYLYWNDRGKLHYTSWGTLIAQRLNLPERDLNVHCIIGHEIGFHQFGGHSDSSPYYPPTNCF